MVDLTLLNELSIKQVFVGIGIDALLSSISNEEDYLVLLFEKTTHGTIWVTDDKNKGHCVFVPDTNGVNKNKLLKVLNPNAKTLFLWHIDGVMFQHLSKCDCALLHDKLMHLVEFKANAQNQTGGAIEANYEKASEQIAITYEQFMMLYEQAGKDLWEIVDDIDALIVFDKTVPQDNAYQKKVKKQFTDRTSLKLEFGNVIYAK